MIRDEKGQSLVEMALVVPVLILLLVGIFDIGRMTFTYASLHFTAQETVRLGGLGSTDQEMETFALGNFNGDATDLEITITPQPDMRVSGDYITVTIDYPIKPLTPFVNLVFPDPITLSVDSTIRIE